MEEYDVPFFVVEEELKAIHRIDRELYVRLVITMDRDPMQSMRIMALWLWLQQIGFPNIVETLSSQTDQVLRGVADEAVRVINSLGLQVLPIDMDLSMPITQNLMQRPISIFLIHHYRGFAIAGINRTVNEIFIWAFNDIIHQANAIAPNAPAPVGNVGGGNGNDQQGPQGGGNGNNQQGPQGSGARVGSTSASASQHPSTGPSPPARRT